jgi:formylmethanofuran dehydrogenase subunit E
MNKDKHAMIERSGVRLSLIGVPPSSVLEVCDCCHEELPLREVQLVDGALLCRKCLSTPEEDWNRQ